MHKINTITAKEKSVPPSPCDSIPRTNKCEVIAPIIKPTPNVAPIKTVAGKSNNILAISSITPVPILPQIGRAHV